ncbi:MAG: Trk family potassium uptake protein [Chloroflexi bacterium]|nr:Trk family potassium uptake protein [Chloroflexota bacterium]
MALQGRRPGDRRVRIARVRPVEEHLEPLRPRRRPVAPGRLLIIAFLVLIAIGTVLLALPISARDGEWTPLLDAWFTATSAVCVTGLVVVVTADHWSGFGQVVLLLLVQLGGFGIMTGSTLVLMLLGRGRRIGLHDRLVAQQTTGELRLGGVLGVVRMVALFTLAAEAIGAVALTVGFLASGQADGPFEAVWWGVFHAVSALNNAGFDLIGAESLAPFQGDWLVLGPIAVLIVIGSLGFAVVADVASRRRWWRLSVESKLVLLTTAVIIGLGTLAFIGLEWDSPRTLGALPVEERPSAALFEVIALRTAGFSTLPTAALLQVTLFVLMAMMFIGGASGSTAGGIKVNTFSLLLAAIVSTVRGDPAASAFGRRFSQDLVNRAMAVALLSLAFLFLTALALNVATPLPFVNVLFETISALGTVGADSGVTPTLDPAGRVIVIAAMFIGRLGPLTLVLVLAARARPVAYRHAEESIRIG